MSDQYVPGDFFCIQMIDECKRNIENCTEAELDEELVAGAATGQTGTDLLKA